MAVLYAGGRDASVGPVGLLLLFDGFGCVCSIREAVNHVDVGRVADIHPTESSTAASRRRAGWNTQWSECRQRAIGRRRWWSRPGVEDVAFRDGRHETRLDNATG